MANVDSYKVEYLSHNSLAKRSIKTLINIMFDGGTLLDKYIKTKIDNDQLLTERDKYAVLNNLEKAGAKIDYNRNFYEQLIYGVDFISNTTSALKLSLDFSKGSTNGLSGTFAAGLAQKVDNTFQQINSGFRITDRGLIVETASKNNIFPSIPLNGSGYSQGSTFSAVNTKIGLIPGQNAYEYVSDGTNAILSETTSALSGTFTAGYECLWTIIETTATTQSCYMFMEDTTNASQNMLALNMGSLQTATPSWGTAVPGSINQTWWGFSLGIGPNGGTLWLAATTGTAIVTGGVRRVRVRPNGASTPTAGWSVIIHHVQHEVGQYPTSPIISGLSAPGTRTAEDIRTPLANGTYNMRYILQDGTRIDRLGVVITDGSLHIPTDICQQPGLNSISVVTTINQRVGYISKIEAWTPLPDLHEVGDSFGGQPTRVWLPYYLPPRNYTYDYQGGATTVQEADLFDATPQYWNNVLIIMDGGVSNGETPATYLAGIARMIGRLTTNKEKWLYIQSFPTGNVGGNEIGGAWYIYYLSIVNSVLSTYPTHFVPTLTLMQQLGSDGTANDISDINNGWIPRSCTQDGLHPSEKGSKILTGNIIAPAIITRGW